MKLVGSGEQQRLDEIYDASFSFASGGSFLILPRSFSRSMLIFSNAGTTSIWVQFGPARATAAITNGAVSSVTVANAGQNYSAAPTVRFFGGGNTTGYQGNPSAVGVGQPGATGPSNVALAHCVMSGTAPNMSIASIVIDSPGSGYSVPPYVYLDNSVNDPNGVAIAAANTGYLVLPSSPPIILNGTACPTGAMSAFGSSGGFLACGYMT